MMAGTDRHPMATAILLTSTPWSNLQRKTQCTSAAQPAAGNLRTHHRGGRWHGAGESSISAAMAQCQCSPYCLGGGEPALSYN